MKGRFFLSVTNNHTKTLQQGLCLSLIHLSLSRLFCEKKASTLDNNTAAVQQESQLIRVLFRFIFCFSVLSSSLLLTHFDYMRDTYYRKCDDQPIVCVCVCVGMGVCVVFTWKANHVASYPSTTS